jgi:Ca2+-binding EF-hand superfamily protein
MSLIDKLSKE